MVKQFHDHTGRISLEVLRIFADFHVHKNQCLIPGWTRSFADNVRYLTLVTKGNSCIRIWNEIGKSALRIRFIDAVSFSCSSTVVFFALKYCGGKNCDYGYKRLSMVSGNMFLKKPSIGYSSFLLLNEKKNGKIIYWSNFHFHELKIITAKKDHCVYEMNQHTIHSIFIFGDKVSCLVKIHPQLILVWLCCEKESWYGFSKFVRKISVHR